MKKVHVFVAVNRKVSLSIHKARGEYRVRLYTAAHQLKWARRNSALRNIRQTLELS